MPKSNAGATAAKLNKSSLLSGSGGSLLSTHKGVPGEAVAVSVTAAVLVEEAQADQVDRKAQGSNVS